ncbi:MAG: hypothetical protein WCJ56_00205 [bacterium]
MKEAKEAFKKDKVRGYVFLLAMVTMVILSLLGLASIRAASASLIQANKGYLSAQSLALAEGALDLAEAHHRFQNTKNILTDVLYPVNLSLGGGILNARLVHVSNPYNPVAKNHRVYATGKDTQALRGGSAIERKIVGEFVDQSFSVYGYFEDTGLGNNWWVSDISHFDGPFHTNNKLQISWSSAAAHEIFNGPVSSVNGAITYYSGQSAPTTDPNWQKIFAGGKSAWIGNDRTISFPTDVSFQKGSAWGSDTGFPDTSTTAKIQANADVKMPMYTGTAPSGIYIVTGKDPGSTGNDYPPQIFFSVDAQGRQVITIKHSVYSGSSWQYRTTEITSDLVNGTTSKRSKTGTTVDAGTWSSSSSYPDLLNGVLFSDKGIAALEGTLADNYVNNNVVVNANAWTVTTDFSASKNITITNNLTYQHEVDATKQLTDPLNLRVPYLGMVGSQVVIAPPKPPFWAASATRAVGDKIWPGTANSNLNGYYYVCTQAGKSGTSVPSSWSTTNGASITDGTAKWTPMKDDVTVDGVIMATSTSSGGSITTQAQIDGQKRGACTINGGCIVKTAAIIGTFNGTKTTQGYDENYKYDVRMAEGPLTGFPSTDSLSIISWQIVY